MFSDSTITEDTPVQHNEDNTGDGDAYPSEDTATNSVAEEPANGSASQSVEETIQEDTPVNNVSHVDEESNDDTPVPIRRSTRERRPPAWFRSGEFDVSKSAVTPRTDWKNKVSSIGSLAEVLICFRICRHRQVKLFWILSRPCIITPDSCMPGRHFSGWREYVAERFKCLFFKVY